MKKQLLIAAVAATMTSVAFADVSITGAAQVNYNNLNSDTAGTADVNTITHDFDLKITGKSGATSIVMDIENTDAAADATDLESESNSSTTADSRAQVKTDNELNVKNAYMTTAIAGVNVKMGTYYGSDTLLSDGGQTEDKVSLDTTMSGVKVQYEDDMTDSSVTLSGSVAGLKITHEMFNKADKTDSSVSGTFGGVNAAYRSISSDTAKSDATSLEVSTDVQGMTVTYAAIDANDDATDASGVTSDAFFGTFAKDSEIKEATGFGVKTSMAGNTVNLKSYSTKAATANSVDVDYTKLVVTRPLASGATAEFTYTDIDNVSTAMDLELRVKF